MAEGDSSSFEEPNFLESEMSEEQDHSDEEDPIYDPGELDSRGSRRYIRLLCYLILPGGEK